MSRSPQNLEIETRLRHGERQADLVLAYGWSRQRINNIASRIGVHRPPRAPRPVCLSCGSVKAPEAKTCRPCYDTLRRKTLEVSCSWCGHPYILSGEQRTAYNKNRRLNPRIVRSKCPACVAKAKGQL